jgi:hypothetical protein
MLSPQFGRHCQQNNVQMFGDATEGGHEISRDVFPVEAIGLAILPPLPG